MSAHSPGPWALLIQKQTSKKWNNESAMVSTQRGVMAIDCYQSGDTFEEACANARLIAAAPDLLEALKAMLRAPLPHEDEWRMPTYVVKARAAIAKAEWK